MKNTRAKKTSRRLIRHLASELKEPIAAFQLWYGIGLSDLKIESTQAESGEATNLEADEYGEGDSDDCATSSGHADPEDIQMAVHLAMSNLQDEGLIPDDVTELSDICEQLFGSEDEITKDAAEFEELINGYEGSAPVAELRRAYDLLASIIGRLKELGQDGNDQERLFE